MFIVLAIVVLTLLLSGRQLYHSAAAPDQRVCPVRVSLMDAIGAEYRRASFSCSGEPVRSLTAQQVFGRVSQSGVAWREYLSNACGCTNVTGRDRFNTSRPVRVMNLRLVPSALSKARGSIQLSLLGASQHAFGNAGSIGVESRAYFVRLDGVITGLSPRKKYSIAGCEDPTRCSFQTGWTGTTDQYGTWRFADAQGTLPQWIAIAGKPTTGAITSLGVYDGTSTNANAVCNGKNAPCLFSPLTGFGVTPPLFTRVPEKLSLTGSCSATLGALTTSHRMIRYELPVGLITSTDRDISIVNTSTGKSYRPEFFPVPNQWGAGEIHVQEYGELLTDGTYVLTAKQGGIVRGQASYTMTCQ